MKIQYFSVFDSKTNSFGQVFPSQTYGSAQRSFQEAIANPDSQYGKYPEDFSLFHVFDFDDDFGSASFENPAPIPICKALDLIPKTQ